VFDKIEKSRHFGSGTDELLCLNVIGRHLLCYCPTRLLLTEILTVNTAHATSELKWKIPTNMLYCRYWQ